MATKKKRKPKMVKMKIWACWEQGKVWACEDPFNLVSGRFPCTILIESKYLKGDK